MLHDSISCGFQRVILEQVLHNQHANQRASAVKRAIADSQHSAYSPCLAWFLTCHSGPFSFGFCPQPSSVSSSIRASALLALNAHACTLNSMCLSIMRFKMGKLILGKWQVCLSRWEGMTFLPRATSSPPPNSPTKE